MVQIIQKSVLDQR